MENRLPYSYHTFLFPFIWKTKPEITLGAFEEILQVGTNWTEHKWADMMQAQDVSKDEKKKNEWFQNYAAYQYFTTAASNAIFNADGKDVVKCYVLNKQNGTYNIHKDNETFTLKINQIRLNVYEAGIAIMIFELEYNPENNNDRTLDVVNKINEYGRRINFPFLMEGSHSLCADQIYVKFDGSKEIVEEFKKTSENIKEHIKGDVKGCHCSLNYVMKPIQDILDGGNEKITSNPAHEGKFLIKPCTDDRMFVCCMVLDAAFSEELKDIDRVVKGLDNNIEDCSDETTLSSRLYKLLFIENSLSCQNNMMKQEILKSCVYRRWSNYGTINGVTHHSLVAVNNGDNAIIANVINPFLTEYVQMAILALAQRSVLLMLEDEAAGISNSFGDETVISHDELSAIESLQEKYIRIQNQLLLSEITVQEQGVELYEMMREQLYIQKNMNDLDAEMSNLRDISGIVNARLERQNDAAEEEKFNMIGILLALLALVEPLAMAFMLRGKERCEGILWLVLSIFLAGGILLYYFVYKPHKKK